MRGYLKGYLKGCAKGIKRVFYHCILFAILLFLLPIQVMADVVMCFPWDTTKDSYIPSGVTPNVYDAGMITTGTYKFCEGAIKDDPDAPFGDDEWIYQGYSGLSGLPRNEGAFEFWFNCTNPEREDIAHGYHFDVTLAQLSDSGANAISIEDGPYSGNLRTTEINMRDSGNNIIIQDSFEHTTIYSGWHHVSFNWRWNDAAGFTKMFWDGVEIYSSTAGNTKSRDGGSKATIDLYNHTPYSGWLDDFTIWDEVQHSSNFSVPTRSQCIVKDCAAPTIALHFGRPYGWAFGKGWGH